MIREDSVSVYLEKLASALPTPGAGCAAAMTGAQAVALLSMVCNLTLNKRSYSAVKEEIKQLKEFFDNKRKLFLHLAERDMDSFESVIKAYKMPKQNEWDKLERTEEIQAGLKRSADIPLKVLQESVEILPFSVRLAQIGYRKVVSDIHVARLLLNACIQSSRVNLEYNIKQIKDKAFCKERVVAMKKLMSENVFENQ